MTTERTTGYNTRFASCGVTCLHLSSVFQLGFCAGLTVLCSEIPHERKAWERCATFFPKPHKIDTLTNYNNYELY